MLSSTMIISGEKIQELCDIFIGFEEDFNFNPRISKQTNKHINFNNINNNFNNPYKIFCYSHNINMLSTKIHFFQNNFILFSHNSDGNIDNINEVITILNCDKLEKWYAQNLCTDHYKLHLLPIGIANSMWPHGNLSIFDDTNIINNLQNKTKKVYFNFNIHTNWTKRQICYEQLKNKLEWLQTLNPFDNMYRLKDYEFCICPEGNGVDTHRLWEALYLKVVPVVLKSKFTNSLMKNNLPLVILDSWNDFDINNLNYNNYNFDKIFFLNTFS